MIELKNMLYSGDDTLGLLDKIYNKYDKKEIYDVKDSVYNFTIKY